MRHWITSFQLLTTRIVYGAFGDCQSAHTAGMELARIQCAGVVWPSRGASLARRSRAAKAGEVVDGCLLRLAARAECSYGCFSGLFSGLRRSACCTVILQAASRSASEAIRCGFGQRTAGCASIRRRSVRYIRRIPGMPGFTRSGWLKRVKVNMSTSPPTIAAKVSQSRSFMTRHVPPRTSTSFSR